MTRKLRESSQIKENAKHFAEHAVQIVQDIWRQTKDFNVELPTEVERSVVEIESCRLFQKIENFFNGLEKEKINLQFSIHHLHVEHNAADEKWHDTVLSALQMSDAEHLVPPLCPAAALYMDTQ
ncbi:hypothetical protein B0H14DRAFT_2600274 [Mycena olivaceomarginata]|nr:hypothetical protein B0H14DRAFT_2600274 [Mycena olivaceomarginata]